MSYSAVDLLYRFGTALVIGILIGLQREYAHGEPSRELVAGARTFALIALLGALAAMMGDRLGTPWGFISICLVMGALITVAYAFEARRGLIGLTSEVAALVTFLAGALCYWDYLQIAASLAVVTTILLSLKVEMQWLARRISPDDIYATLKFAVITIVVLPLLPNQSFAPAPFDVLNPYKIWLMIVFISGISFLGYVLNQLVNPRHGTILIGLLGGLVSSTAVTLSLAHRSRQQPQLARSLALAIIGAWVIMFLRILIEVAALNLLLFQVLWLPLILLGAVGLAYGIYLHRTEPASGQDDAKLSNPFELGSAFKFGFIYALILLVSRIAQMYFGNAGVYASSLVAGFVDVDAITLTMAELSGAAGGTSLGVAARSIILAALSNTTVKIGIVLSVGAPSLRRALLPIFVILLLSGIAVALVSF